MNFFTARDLRTTPKNVWEKLRADGEVVITNNGRPTALMLDITDNNLEEVARAFRQAKAMIAFNSMRKKAAGRGFMSDEEIDGEIATYRKEHSEP
jgi:antitoxin (DNA-binding transcriptional repressor) of toxin-antitoxin stability system